MSSFERYFGVEMSRAFLTFLLIGGVLFLARWFISAPPYAPDGGFAGEAIGPQLVPSEVGPLSLAYGELRDLAFEFVNPANNPDSVTIESVIGSCSCIVGDERMYAGAVAAPGHRIHIPVRIIAAGIGFPRTHTLTVNTSDGASYSSTLTLTVEETYVLRPPHVDFGEVNLNEMPTRPERLTRSVLFIPMPARIAGCPKSDSSWLNVAVRATREGGAELILSIEPELLVTGSHTGRVYIPVSDASRQYAQVVASVVAVAAVTAHPAIVFLRPDDAAEVHVRADGRIVPITEVTIPEESVRGESVSPGLVRLHRVGKLAHGATIASVIVEGGIRAKILVVPVD